MSTSRSKARALPLKRIGIGLIAALALLAAAPAVIGAQSATHGATLSGTTDATGSFTALVDDAAQTGEFNLTVSSITGATAAHIHAGAAGVNGGVVVPLFSSPDAPMDGVNVSGSFGAADLRGDYAGNWAGFLEAMNAGTLYVNVHTQANPGGEVRGQVEPVGGVQTPTPTDTAEPAPADTGNAGLFGSTGTAAGIVALLLALALAAVGGARFVTRTSR